MPTLKVLLFGVLSLAVVIALATDLKIRRIPDSVTYPAMAIALVLRVWRLLDRAEYKRRQAPPGVTPDRAKTFTRGAGVDDLTADGSTAGAPPAASHLRSIVGLVWRSVVLWMLLLTLLTLANLIG